LAASYVETRGIPALWYQIDAGDADLGTFFYFLGLAGRKAAPDEGEPLATLTAEYRHDVPTFSRNFIEALCQRLASPSLLVFDNCHLAGEEAAFYAALLEGLNRLPEGSSFVFLSCSDPPACFARARANRQMEVIPAEELKLTAEEFGELARREGLDDPAPDRLRALHQRLDGWVAGLLLLLEASKLEGSAPGSLAEGETDCLFEYFSGEVFDNLDEETRDFLLRTSSLPLLTPEYVTSLTGSRRGTQILEQLHRTSCFTEKRVHPSYGYQYHPLFREFLMARAEKHFQPDELAQVESRAARLLAERGQPDEAAELFRRSGDWEGLAGLVMGHAHTLIEQGRSRTLEGWIRCFPPELLAERPWLQCWLGASLMPMDTEGAYTCFGNAFELFREAGDHSGSLLACAGAIDATVWSFANLRRGQRWIRRLYELIPGPEALPRGDLGARVAASIYSLLALGAPGHPDLVAWRNKALEAAEARGTTSAAMQIRFHGLVSAGNRGETELLERIMATIREANRSGSLSPFARVVAGASEVTYLAYQGRYEQCLQVAEESLETASATGVRALDPILIGSAVGAALHLGRHDLARDHLRNLEDRLLYLRPWNRSLFHFLSARLALCEGEFEKVAALGQLALEEADEVGGPYPEVTCHLLLSEIAQSQGDDDEATRQLAAAREKSEAAQLHALLPLCLLNEAYGHFVRGNDEAGLATLRRALEGTPRFSWAYCPRREILAELCGRALRAGIETDRVTQLIRSFELPPPLAMEIGAWPWPLRIHTLGGFELLRDGEAVEPAGKMQRKPLELLQLLLAMGGRKVPETRLSAALWPDAEGDMGHRSFATTLHRLRKLLGLKGAVELREGRVSLNPRYCWVDAWALEDLLDAAESARNDADGALAASTRERIAGWIHSALELYRGPFLEDLELESWCIPLRERLRSRLLRGVEALGRDLEEARRWEEAIGCYREALKIDPLLEPCYRRLMVCLAEAGRRAEALATYERCHEVLAKTCSVSPSEETRSLRLELLEA
jgi:DNA-binding SARP family transcriptional activator